MNKECIGCGLCEAMCHRQAIKVDENSDGSYAKVDENLCDNCGLCEKLCPVPNLKEKEDLSKAKYVAVGKSLNDEVVKASASGGIVSEILIHLFEIGEIDAAIVAHYDKHANIYGDVIESGAEVLLHAGSYYHTSKQLLNIKKITKYRKVAVVGLPCHIEGVLNYLELTRQKDKVTTIALFCTVGRTYEGFRQFFLQETGFDVATGNVCKYVSRYGEKKLIHIEDDKGNVYECPDENYKYKMDFFWANKTCLECRKLYGLSADISVGDAWHRVMEKNGIKGKIAMISANTDYGKKMLKTIAKNVQLEYAENGAYELVSSQTYGASLKQIHNMKTVNKLDKLRRFRFLANNALLSRIICKIRDNILKELALYSEKVKECFMNNV